MVGVRRQSEPPDRKDPHAHTIKLQDTLTFVADGPDTSVTYHAEFNPEGAAKLASPLMPPALKLLADKATASMEEKLTRL